MSRLKRIGKFLAKYWFAIVIWFYLSLGVVMFWSMVYMLSQSTYGPWIGRGLILMVGIVLSALVLKVFVQNVLGIDEEYRAKQRRWLYDPDSKCGNDRR